MEKTRETVMAGVKKATTEQLERFLKAHPYWRVCSDSVRWVRDIVEIELTERYLDAI